MVIAGTINRVAFYCRVNHRDRDYEKYLDDVMRRLEEEYGKQKWNLQIFFEEASGVDPNRKEFNRLKAEIAASLTFDLYLLNVGSSRIGKLLDYMGVKTVTGTTWESGTINGIRSNFHRMWRQFAFWQEKGKKQK